MGINDYGVIFCQIFCILGIPASRSAMTISATEQIPLLDSPQAQRVRKYQ